MVLLTISAAWLFFVKGQLFWGIVIMVVVSGLAFNTIQYFNLINKWIASFLLGIENEDTTLKIPVNTGSKTIDEIFKGMQRLNELFRRTKSEIGTQEQYYLSIINQSATGLFSVNEQGRIININPAAEKLTGLIAFHHINTLSRISDTLPGFILDQKTDQASKSAIFENNKGQKLLFKLSEIITFDEVIKLVVVSDITKELDIREVDAWIKLARTLSHEIMNNIAPITTLSQVTLNYFVHNEQAVSSDSINQDTISKTIKGLRVIEERSAGLQKFVNNSDVSDLISKVLLVCSGFKNFNRVQLEERLPDSLITVTDEDLLSQVLINLIKNALESFDDSESVENPVIQIRAEKETHHIKIDICNNGQDIPPELREQIFIPFFTTKEGGTGIGLSLSKQVMLKLGGDIKLGKNSQGYTCFTVSLPQGQGPAPVQ
jgi:nitrogen fixation/metabolism regulation signal transduction histidine kinase